MKQFFLLLTLISISLTSFAQQNVTGKVKDPFGEPIIGASIVIKNNTNIGTITDMEGNFVLNALPKSTLIISYIR